MPQRLAQSLTALAAFAAFAVPTARLPTQDGLRLTKVPDRIVLPPPAGGNLLIEVTASKRPERIWLASNRDQIGGVDLRPSGDRHWQINLADPKVLRLLPADRERGTLKVFARVERRVIESAEIAWSRREVPIGRVKCFLVDRDGQRREGTKEQVHWLDTSKLESIEIHGTTAPRAKVLARAGEIDFPLAWRARERQFRLELNDGLRDSMQLAGTLAIEIRTGPETRQFRWRVVPDRVTASDEQTFIVKQRRIGLVPGTRGWLEVRLGDITKGQVLLSIRDASDRVVVAERSVAPLEGVDFSLPGGTNEYTLRIDRLVNRLVGDDHAELSVVPAKMFRADVITLLIRRVEATEGLTFVREGREYDAKMAARLLRARLGSHRGKRPTPREFAVLAGRSSTTGKPYLVRTKRDPEDENPVDEIPAQEWLESQITAIERGITGGPKGQKSVKKFQPKK
ncbi:MAG: DUF5329 family protein [bacterium]|nr:DUF5329 family protein [bacterium]